MAARSPDYVLKVKLKDASAGSTQGRVGAAWKNEDGSLSVQLDVGTVLDWRLSREAHITLFPADEERRGR